MKISECRTCASPAPRPEVSSLGRTGGPGCRAVALAALFGAAMVSACGASTKPHPESASRASMAASTPAPATDRDGAAIDALIKHDTAAFAKLCSATRCDEGDPRYAGATPLQIAAVIGDENAAQVLLNNGSDLGAKNSDGRDALMMAAEGGRANMVRMLLRRGSNVNAVDAKGATPILLASLRNHPDVVAELLRSGADLTLTDDLGQTPLHVAVARGRMRVARMLIEHGADVNAEDEEGWTPLRLARRYGYPGLEQLLLRAGAQDLDAQEESIATDGSDDFGF